MKAPRLLSSSLAKEMGSGLTILGRDSDLLLLLLVLAVVEGGGGGSVREAERLVGAAAGSSP